MISKENPVGTPLLLNSFSLWKPPLDKMLGEIYLLLLEETNLHGNSRSMNDTSSPSDIRRIVKNICML